MPYNLRSRCEMGNDDMVPFSEELKTYFENLIRPLVTCDHLNESLENFKSEILEKIGSLESRLTEKEKIISENGKNHS